jgi:DNA-binding CsgD family transcriptional regulator
MVHMYLCQYENFMPDQTSRPESPPERASSIPIGAAQNRQMPAAIVIDGENRLVLANDRARKLLREVAGAELIEDSGELPPVLKALVPELRSRVRERLDTSTVALLTIDNCVRACLMEGASGRHLLLVFERVERKDAVQHNLERYALSPRECEVVMLVLYGYSNRRIADQLFLTEYTVEDHFKRVFAKLGVRSRTALAAKILGWHAG